ncbi:MAG: tetratricopeptide repeat protein [Acidobacteriota bacterium]
MAHKVIRVFLTAAFTLCFAGLCLAQTERPPVRSSPTSRDVTGNGSITGRVVLPSGHPVAERIRITLSTINDPGLALYTDANGFFNFDNLPQGNYYVEVAGDPKRYEPVTEQVRLMRGMRVSLVLPLREKGAASKSNTGNVVSTAEADQNIPSQAKKEFEKATVLASEGKIREAIERYKMAIEIYPPYLMARNDLGVQYLKLKQLDEAIEQFEAAIDIGPKSFNPRLNISIALVEKKRFSDALEQVKEALSIDSSSPAAHLYFGIASLETDDLDSASRELDKAMALGGPEFGVAHYYKAHMFLKKGEREPATGELKTYLEKFPRGEYADKARAMLDKLKGA